MADSRYLFGSGAGDFAIAPPSRHGGFLVAATSVSNGTFWSDRTGGTKYTDLQTVDGGAATTVATDKDGSVVPFYGPVGVFGGWLDFGLGSRVYVVGANSIDTAVANALSKSQQLADSAAASATSAQNAASDALAGAQSQINASAASAAASATSAQNAANLVAAPAETAVQTVTSRAMQAASVADAFRSTASGVGINILSTTRWRLHANVAPNQVWSQDLYRVPTGSVPGPVSPSPFLLDGATLAVTTPAPPNTLASPTWTPHTDATMTKAGTGAQVGTNSSSYTGTYWFVDVAGGSITWAGNVANSVAVYWRTLTSANGGYVKIAIDGSATAANLLPTAQDEVTAGRLSSSALVANGGSLNPTDRLLSCYSAASTADAQIPMANNLTPGTHTVVGTWTGYKPAASTGTRLYISGMGAAPYATVGSPSTTTHVLFPQGAAYSAYEYALDLESADGTQHDFVGNVHGYDSQTNISVWVDGQPIDTSVIADNTGSEVVIIRDSTLTSPYLSGTVATAKVVYRLNRDGLDVRSTITMAQACKLRTGFLSMYPLDEGLSKGMIVGVPTELSLTTGSGGAAGNQRYRSQAAIAYNPTTGVAACMWLPDLTSVNNWAASGTTDGGLYIEDRAGNVINKMYAAVASSSVKRSLAAGEVLSGRTVYRAMALPNVRALTGL